MRRKRRISFKAADLERGRRYMWREEFVPLLLRYLDIRPGQRVVDVGCGTGFFSRLVARGLRGRGKVVGVDRNQRLLGAAKRIAESEGMSEILSFRRGSAEALPIGNGGADRVVCQTLLWTLSNPMSAVKEMVRVCKRGGLVGAVEGAFDYVTWYVPDDERLTELYRKSVVAQTLGHYKVSGADGGIGYKVPSLFKKAGLRDIRLDAYPYVWLESDDRVPAEFRLEEHVDYIKRYERPNEAGQRARVMLAGGMKKDEIAEMRRRAYERSKRMLQDPSLLNEDASVNGGIFFITTGRK